MAAMLIGHVTVRDEHRVAHTFGPGDDVPAWARKKITNPGAWTDPDEPRGSSAAAAVEKAAEKTAQVSGDVATKAGRRARPESSSSSTTSPKS